MLARQLGIEESTPIVQIIERAEAGLVCAEWSCGGMDAVPTWLAKPDVSAALHLNGPGSGFHYHTSGDELQSHEGTKVRVTTPRRDQSLHTGA